MEVCGRSSRASSSRLFIGHSQPHVLTGGLASVEDVLRVIAWHREQPKSQKKSVESFCCPGNREKVAKCLLEGGCHENEDPCLAFKIKRGWMEAGIITVSDYWIKEWLEEIQEKYNKMFCHRNKESVAVQEERDTYVMAIKKTFDIKDPNAHLAIINDTNRSMKAKEEDLAFYDDYLGNELSHIIILFSIFRYYDFPTFRFLDFVFLAHF
jgi:hypothetical protein